MDGQNIIYALVDPLTDEVRYIGQSSCGLIRTRAHSRESVLSKNQNPHKCNWLRKLKSLGLAPEVRVLVQFEEPSLLDEAERFWIRSFKDLGAPLLNSDEGGRGGGKRSDAHRAKISAALKGKPCPGRGQSQKPFSLDKKREMALKCGGRPFVDQNGTGYPSISEASRVLGVPKSSVSAILNGKMPGSTRGYRFYYEGSVHGET